VKKILVLTIWSSIVFAETMMGGWNSSEETETVKAQQAEQVRLCSLYTDKVTKYKETMRDDEMAQATLQNYIRLQTKYCKKNK
jgi:hypothetical protein